MKYRQRNTITMQEVMRPSDYIWENLSTKPWLRFMKVSISNILALTILVIGFAAIIKAKGVETTAKLALGETDCTLFTFSCVFAPPFQLIICFEDKKKIGDNPARVVSAHACFFTEHPPCAPHIAWWHVWYVRVRACLCLCDVCT